MAHVPIETTPPDALRHGFAALAPHAHLQKAHPVTALETTNLKGDTVQLGGTLAGLAARRDHARHIQGAGLVQRLMLDETLVGAQGGRAPGLPHTMVGVECLLGVDDIIETAVAVGDREREHGDNYTLHERMEKLHRV
eukprot:TRINITY_DN1994_c0_g1_i1.p2 TRINITY_DN1994_c0_g1~~TRINITY_DN1994_c0_g1_i1.p2  ORF type:complete len:152 (-),score=63.17 TRINITY_DN1994_c0_g1_i1:49-462(-)